MNIEDKFEGELLVYVINGKGSLIRLIAGLFVLISTILGLFVSQYFLYFTCFVGLMLTLSSLTGFCPMEYILKAVGAKVRKIQP